MRFRVLSKEMIADGPQYNGFYNIQTQKMYYIFYITFYQRWTYSPLDLREKLEWNLYIFISLNLKEMHVLVCVYTCIHDYVCEEWLTQYIKGFLPVVFHLVPDIFALWYLFKTLSVYFAFGINMQIIIWSC